MRTALDRFCSSLPCMVLFSRGGKIVYDIKNTIPFIRMRETLVFNSIEYLFWFLSFVLHLGTKFINVTHVYWLVFYRLYFFLAQTWCCLLSSQFSLPHWEGRYAIFCYICSFMYMEIITLILCIFLRDLLLMLVNYMKYITQWCVCVFVN